MKPRIRFLAAVTCGFLLGPPCLAPGAAADEIYRCETPEGTVYSDLECGTGAEVVELEPETAGIVPGPPQEVRDQLARKREERMKAEAEAWERAARQPAPAPAPVVYERRVGYPYWLGGFGYGPPRPPIRPEPPVAPPVRPPLRPGGGDVLRPIR